MYLKYIVFTLVLLTLCLTAAAKPQKVRRLPKPPQLHLDYYVLRATASSVSTYDGEVGGFIQAEDAEHNIIIVISPAGKPAVKMGQVILVSLRKVIVADYRPRYAARQNAYYYRFVDTREPSAKIDKVPLNPAETYNWIDDGRKGDRVAESGR